MAVVQFDDTMLEDVQMTRFPFFIPQCDHAVLLVNQRALYLLQKGGYPSFPDLYLHTYYSDPGINSRYLRIAYHELNGTKDYSRLSKFYVTHGLEFEYLFTVARCGKCPLCRSVRQCDLVNRCAMESELYDSPCYFFTLTYKPSCLPRNGQLQTDDVARFFKRLRMNWTRRGIKHNIRYLVAGEYGSRHGRPHYHVLLWNNPYGADEFTPQFHNKLRDDVFRAWSMCELQAFDFGQAGDGAAGYASKYVTKQSLYRLTHKSVPGFHQPFIHTSNRNGGIGRPFIERHAAYYRDNPQLDVFCWISRHDGSYHEVSFGSYIKSVVNPSPCQQIPKKQKFLYRQYVDLLESMVSRNILSFESASRLSRLACPRAYPDILSRRIRVDVLHHDDPFDDFRHYVIRDSVVEFLPEPPIPWDVWLASRLSDAAESMYMELVRMKDCQVVDVDGYYHRLSYARERPDNRGSLAGRLAGVMSRLSDSVAREIL